MTIHNSDSINHRLSDIFADIEANHLRVISLRVSPSDACLLISSDQYCDGFFWGANVITDITVIPGTLCAAGEKIATGKIEVTKTFTLSVTN